jgi:hypothetical protein
MGTTILRVARITLAALVALPLLAFGTAGPAAGQSAGQTACQMFPQTGKQVCGAFLTYWRNNGGLERQGYPISNEFREVSDTDGKTYTVQYFERAVFELHPENRPPHDVLLSLLGVHFYKQKYPNGAPGQTANKSQGAILFEQTGAYLGGAFLRYWQNNGELAQFGYPISQEFEERSDLNGRTYKVQYFERAVFEWHPDNPVQYQVLLSQLGTYQFKRKYPNGPGSQPGTRPLAQGTWGATGAVLIATGSGATVEFDCGLGAINTPITLDAGGKFDVLGTYMFEGGPVYDPGNGARFSFYGIFSIVTGSTGSASSKPKTRE